MTWKTQAKAVKLRIFSFRKDLILLVAFLGLIGIVLISQGVPIPITTTTPSPAHKPLTSVAAYEKIADEPGFETHFVFNDIVGNELVVRFYHDASSAQRVWIEGITGYYLSTALAQPHEQVSLHVPLVDGEVPWFRLHVGS